MNNKRLIALTICCILVAVPGLAVLSFANNESGAYTKAEQHFEKANELRKVIDYDAAITEYKKVISLSPKSKIAQDAQYWIGQSHFKAGQFDDALLAFEKLLDEYPASKIVPSTKQMIERVQQAKKDKSLFEAAAKGDIDRVKALIAAGADANMKDKEGCTPLHIAAHRGHTAVVQLLSAEGASVNARHDEEGWMPLHVAAYSGHPDAVELLLAEGTDVNTRLHTGHTSLHLAAGNGHVDVVELLLAEGANIEARDNLGTTPLCKAANDD
ncbi:MAG: ankyrin repeat domain-containing protein, partial [Planctomycetota bacterium]